jgi:hypothetical protein
MGKKPAFARRHYVALANIVRLARLRPNDSQGELLDDLTQDLADLFARDNPKFKREKFETAAALDWTRERVQ